MIFERRSAKKNFGTAICECLIGKTIYFLNFTYLIILFQCRMPTVIRHLFKNESGRAACKFAFGMHKLHAFWIIFCNIVRTTSKKTKNLIEVLNSFYHLYCCALGAVLELINVYPIIPLLGRSNVVQRYRGINKGQIGKQRSSLLSWRLLHSVLKT